MFKLPTVATAPFCPSEVTGSVTVVSTDAVWKKILRFAGPGLLISIGYMDPGNWATAISAGSSFGYSLLFVVVLSSLAAMLLQSMSLRLGIVTGKDLAKLCSEQYARPTAMAMWFFAELSIIACDIAEVLGCALAFKLILGVSLPVAIGITALDTIFVLGLKGAGFRKVEAIILGLIATISVCLLAELVLLHPCWTCAAQGAMPSLSALKNTESLYLAIGILGATVMPHNLYLHSSVVQTRKIGHSDAHRREAIRFANVDSIISLTFALLINAAILILAAAAFHGQSVVMELDDAYHLLDPVTGSAFAGLIFGIGLLASGQSSTFTGTIAGQVILDGFLQMKIPCWQRRIVTRGLALIPALIGVTVWGEHSVGRLLILSQVVLSLQLPFVMYPMIKMAGNGRLMGQFKSTWPVQALAWVLFVVISGANAWLVLHTFDLL